MLFPCLRHLPSQQYVSCIHGARVLRRRTFASKPPPLAERARARFQRLQRRLPRFVQPYTERVFNAPGSHVISFFILHEITAVVPLVGLAMLFHYAQWLPSYFSEGKWASAGFEKFGNYFRKKGWLGKHDEEGVALARRGLWWKRGEGGMRLLTECVMLLNLLRGTRLMNDMQGCHCICHYEGSPTCPDRFECVGHPVVCTSRNCTHHDSFCEASESHSKTIIGQRQDVDQVVCKRLALYSDNHVSRIAAGFHSLPWVVTTRHMISRLRSDVGYTTPPDFKNYLFL